MAMINLLTDHLRDIRFAQEWMAEGEARGRQEGEATTACIQALPLQQQEALAETLLDFSCPADLSAWLAEHAS